MFLIAHLGGGGAERVTTLLANQFSEKGYKVVLVVFSRKFNDYPVEERVEVVYLPENENKIIDIAGKIRELRKIIKAENPRFLFSLGFSYRYLFVGRLLPMGKFILSERNAPQQHNSNRMDLQIVKYCLRRAYRVVFQTRDEADFYDPTIRGKSVIIPNPIKENLIDVYTGEREKRIVAVSRLALQKNITMLLDAFKLLMKRHPDYALEIYGRGPMEEELKQYAKALGIEERIRFMGFTNDVHDRIRTAAMYVSSSDYEGISNAMLEAMGLGLPVVCTDCAGGGSKEFVITGQNGLLTPVGDAKAFSEAMTYVIEHPNAFEGIEEQAMWLRQSLTIEKITGQWEALLK